MFFHGISNLRRTALTAVTALVLGAGAGHGAVSLVGVHDFSGDTGLVDPAAPFGERGWSVELVPATSDCRGDLAGVRGPALDAKNQGMQVIFRVDYKSIGKQVAVPVNSGNYAQWRQDFFECTTKLGDISNLFIVGNEPNIDFEFNPITPQEYAAAFNNLWNNKPAGVQLLVTFNSPFTDPAWMTGVTNAINGTDGYAIHTGGIRGSCSDPRLPCTTEVPDWWFDNAFQYYRDIIAAITRFRTKPVYITEFNTFTGDPSTRPQLNYQDGWVQKAYEEIRNYNAGRGSNDPEVKALCWFTDKVRNGFPEWSLRNIPVALQDMKDAFRNPANRGGGGGGGGGCSSASLSLPNNQWRMQIYNNISLSGTPADVRYSYPGTRGFSVNWGNGGPGCVGNDNFSIRFKRSAYFSTSGYYTFTTTADDGVRVWVDGVRIINEWKDQAPTTYTAQQWVNAGWRTVQMNFYERGGGATASLDWQPSSGGVGNDVTINRNQSTIPSALAPGETRTVSVHVTNTGSTTWTSGAMHRLGSRPGNNVSWSSWPCGGYNSGLENQRIFLCNNVAPGGSYTFTFNITAPSSGTANFNVDMVQDGVEWFNDTESWSIPITSNNPYPNCPCNRADNYCQHGPNTPGCPMTSNHGYCDPNNDGSYSDGDWNRGWYEYNDYCR